jgi:hypothetical protein
MIELALRTAIPMEHWMRADDQTIATALVVLAEWDRQARRHG